MSAPNVISLDARKAQNEAMWLRTKTIGDNIAKPVLGLFVACNNKDTAMLDKYMRELRTVAMRELELSEVSA